MSIEDYLTPCKFSFYNSYAMKLNEKCFLFMYIINQTMLFHVFATQGTFKCSVSKHNYIKKILYPYVGKANKYYFKGC